MPFTSPAIRKRCLQQPLIFTILKPALMCSQYQYVINYSSRQEFVSVINSVSTVSNRVWTFSPCSIVGGALGDYFSTLRDTMYSAIKRSK